MSTIQTARCALLTFGIVEFPSMISVVRARPAIITRGRRRRLIYRASSFKPRLINRAVSAPAPNSCTATAIACEACCGL